MSTVRKVRPITVEEYLEGEMVGDIRHEFVGGEIYSMVGASERRNLIAGAFHFALFGHLRGSGCRVFAGTKTLPLTSVHLDLPLDEVYRDVLPWSESTPQGRNDYDSSRLG